MSRARNQKTTPLVLMSQYIQETTRTLVIAICCIKISRTEEIYFVVSAYDVEIR